jgi:pre-mRNA-splicing factor 18
MDLLKRELERKKKVLAASAQTASSSSRGRYVKAGDLRRAQEEREEEDRRRAARVRQRQDEEQQTKRSDDIDGDHDSRLESTKRPRTLPSSPLLHPDAGKKEVRWTVAEPTADVKDRDKNNLSPFSPSRASSSEQPSPSEITRQLRALGLPIRLFGERTILVRGSTEQPEDARHDDNDRWQRLQVASEQRKKTLAHQSEANEYRLDMEHSIRNPFLEKEEDELGSSYRQYISAATALSPRPTESSRDEANQGSGNKPGGEAKAAGSKTEAAAMDDDDDHKRIYKYFKGLLKDWEDDLARRPDDVKRSIAGKNETKTLKQCRDYIRPLFKLCKNRNLEEGLTRNLVAMVEYCQQGEFVKAHDKYLDVAIGRAAWPIGVTMVGIHARSGRAKIESQNVAHVMNSELQRKYLTSVKRLLTFAQKQRTDVDPSKKVMN